MKSLIICLHPRVIYSRLGPNTLISIFTNILNLRSSRGTKFYTHTKQLKLTHLASILSGKALSFCLGITCNMDNSVASSLPRSSKLPQSKHLGYMAAHNSRYPVIYECYDHGQITLTLLEFQYGVL
jgi:hypothetical protein